MVEIINFTTRERTLTEGDSQLVDAAFEYAFCLDKIEALTELLRLIEKREGPNVVPFDVKDRRQEALEIATELSGLYEELRECKAHIEHLRSKLSAGAKGDMSSVPIEF